jgi:hypothetical protein
MQARIILFLLLYLIISSCARERTRFDVDISGVPAQEVNIMRYGKSLFELDHRILKEELQRIQADYTPFLSGDLEQPENVEKIRNFVEDTLLVSVYEDCVVHFHDMSRLESDLSLAFRHYLYHFPDAKIPGVFTYISGFDYQHPVHLYDNHLLIALDMYLGADYPYYRQLGLPAYVLTRFSPEYIVRDCAEELADRELFRFGTDHHLLGRMILEGKRLWFIRSLVPALKDEVLFDYTTEKMAWARRNEGLVWAFLIENELLYSTQTIDFQKFINHAPFTSFFGNESPPRLGWWIGYRIVNAYMNRNQNISLGQLLQESNAQKILNESGYKPAL